MSKETEEILNKMQNLKLNIDYEPEYNSYVIRVNY